MEKSEKTGEVDLFHPLRPCFYNIQGLETYTKGLSVLLFEIELVDINCK